MSKTRPMIDAEGEVRELTRDDIRRLRPADETLPTDLARLVKSHRHRGPQKTSTKIPVSIRLSPNVVERFKQGGRGWQGRIDAALQEWIKEHS